MRLRILGRPYPKLAPGKAIFASPGYSKFLFYFKIRLPLSAERFHFHRVSELSPSP